MDTVKIVAWCDVAGRSAHQDIGLGTVSKVEGEISIEHPDMQGEGWVDHSYGWTLGSVQRPASKF